LAKALESMGFTAPTPIQASAIPAALEGKDVLGTAQTGTGKTGAFGIPMLARLAAEPGKQALILAPSRELAAQISAVLRQMARGSKQRGALVVGGESFPRQRRDLAMSPAFIVATPGRLNDHIKEGSADLSNVGILVLDECDRMLDMGFAPQIQEVVEAIPPGRQTLLFSATLPPEIMKLASSLLNNPVRISTGPTNKPTAHIDQQTLVTKLHEKNDHLLEQVNERTGKILVFTRTKFRADKVAFFLHQQGHDVVCLHGGHRQGKRKEALECFRSGSHRIMVATDLAGRGIDVADIEHVVNYDVPANREDYIHRIGRTGRFGKAGQAITFVSHEREGHGIVPKTKGGPPRRQRGGSEMPPPDFEEFVAQDKPGAKPSEKPAPVASAPVETPVEPPVQETAPVAEPQAPPAAPVETFQLDPDVRAALDGEEFVPEEPEAGDEAPAPEKKKFEKKPFGGKKPFGKKPFGKKPFGQKSTFGRKNHEGSFDQPRFEGEGGEGRPFRKPFKKPFGQKPFGKKPFGKPRFEGQGEGRPWQKPRFEAQGEGRPFKKPFGKPRFEGQGEGRPQFDRKPWGKSDSAPLRRDRPRFEGQGEGRPFKKPFGKPRFEGGEGRPQFDRKPWDRPRFEGQGEGRPFRKPFGQKPWQRQEQGEGRPQFGGPRKPWDRPRFEGQGEGAPRKPWGKPESAPLRRGKPSFRQQMDEAFAPTAPHPKFNGKRRYQGKPDFAPLRRGWPGFAGKPRQYGPRFFSGEGRPRFEGSKPYFRNNGKPSKPLFGRGKHSKFGKTPPPEME
jgi:superfamily II DNA/RNA helicase